MRLSEEAVAVPAGPLAYRRRLRQLGPLMALLPPGVALLCAGLAALALPTSLVVGMPWEGSAARYLVMAASSVALWMLLGWMAARRATRSPVADWRDWWREFVWPLVGVWAGVLGALALLAYVVEHRTFL
jgi:hypothetical protein